MPLAEMPGLDCLVAREENGSFILGLWLGWWEVPEVQEQRTVEGIQLLVLIWRQSGSEPMAGLGPRHILVTIATLISGLLKKGKTHPNP